MSNTQTTRKSKASRPKPKRRSSPTSVFPPVLVFLLAISAGVGLNFALPSPIAPGNLVRILSGLFLFVGGAILWLTAWLTFRRHNEVFSHRFSTRQIITTGPYSISRHPAYVGYVMIGVGIALVQDNPWILLMLPIAVAYVHTAAVRREERYLMSKFEEPYQRYRMDVRRWL